MPNFDILREVKPKKSFRIASVIGKFDLQSEHIIERFTGSFDLPENWQIGLIVGKSGTGKTTIAKELFTDAYITDFKYESESILDDMPSNKSIEEITSIFNSVGFSSPPSWLKPYSVLSNGEKMRVDLANAILSDKDLFVFDEFTSVVDRNIAQIGSFAMQKSIRKTNKKFIAVTCHFDITEWLLPDWIFNTDTMTFHIYEGQKKNRPEINFKIFHTKDRGVWKMFSKYHYLNYTHQNSAQIYLCYINDQLIGFISVMHYPHPTVKNFKKVHRLVILPDYQGLGLGILFLNKIANIYKNNKFRFRITTSAPSLIYSLKKNNNWICSHFGRYDTIQSNKSLGRTASINRITGTFEFK